ncbi:hypothetical protein [Bradyrhizobium sp. HKCCYLS20291]|uniref:hypothetical protein n=1 Tax=Bradyrhizobium sp. HKCCYLS20291 TaxID=3420766 RepID=UPI003EB887B9
MKRSKRKQKIDADRIQRAITGMIISMTAIPRVYAHAEMLIADGVTDDQLKAAIRQYLGEPV